MVGFHATATNTKWGHFSNWPPRAGPDGRRKGAGLSIAWWRGGGRARGPAISGRVRPAHRTRDQKPASLKPHRSANPWSRGPRCNCSTRAAATGHTIDLLPRQCARWRTRCPWTDHHRPPGDEPHQRTAQLAPGASPGPDRSSAPGSRFSYSGEGFVLLLGRALQAVTGQPPPNCWRSTLAPTAHGSQQFAAGPDAPAEHVFNHDAQGHPTRRATPRGQANAAASLTTTAGDYAASQPLQRPGRPAARNRALLWDSGHAGGLQPAQHQPRRWATPSATGPGAGVRAVPGR